jgi:two-component system sensor histidine kinase SenX3
MTLITLLAGVAIGIVITLLVRSGWRQGDGGPPAVVDRTVEDVTPLAAVTGPTADSSRLTDALDALSVGIVVTDASGRILVKNRTALVAAGARHGDILVDEALERQLRVALAGEPSDQTLDLLGPPHRILAIRARPVDGGGAIATLTDLTERVRLDAVRTDFVANVSHELKTPVGAISLLAETLAETLPDTSTGSGDAQVVRRLADQIVREAERLGNLIDDLLELSRIELGGEPVRDVVHATWIMKEAAERVQPLADRRGIKISVVEPVPDVDVLGDRHQLGSALGNLVDNAVKYSESSSTVRLSAETDGSMATFVVADSGIGIPARDLDRIFERFYRVDRARARGTGGTGLGLSIVRHIASNHGGEVTVESREGEGSTFRLQVPAAPSHDAGGHP